MEPYWIYIKGSIARKKCARPRIRAHNLRIEKCRHRRPVKLPVPEIVVSITISEPQSNFLFQVKSD